MSGKFIYGKNNLLPAKIELKDVMVTISLRIEGDLLDAIRRRANEESIPYQTYMKKVLREHLLGKEKNLSQAELARRLEALEDFVHGSSAKTVAQSRKPSTKKSTRRR